MVSLGSAAQLCRVLLPLHVVFLSVWLVESSASNGDIKECIRSNGVEYRGEQLSSSSGLTCLNWTSTNRDYDVQVHPDSLTGVGDHNYCRNPDSSPRPWCYIVSPDGTIQRQSCAIETCKEQNSTEPAEAESLDPTGSAPPTEGFQPAKSGASQGEVAAVKPVIGISQRVHTAPKKKKDLGTTGYVLGILMMAVIILLGAGITVGYFYKRGRDIKKQHDQRVYEREMQRINLPLAAFSNPTCELIDENTIVITAEQETTPVQEGLEGMEGGDPLMGQQNGTPGA
ncbi:phosphoinositide-3-kinase-interacting protein 1 [Limanda limanda]|uniref:phosphoinositide-3-kinase-interacting protein 1 n=1 Tax=Limanda limanda TaxID=27771 RepID=UPI0029C71825|nr:phosphoinositide-3-kinase-interacting protein 1 [Limanda limanda]